jgi:hypothetical protein
MTLRRTVDRIAMRSRRAFALARAVLGRGHAPPAATAEWVRYRIRSVCSHPDAVHIDVSHGVAVVTGPVLAPERQPIVVAELQGAPLQFHARRAKWLARIGRGLLVLFGLSLAWQASRLRRR